MFDADLFGNKSVPEINDLDDGSGNHETGRVGQLGQHLASYDILSRGYHCTICSEGLPYDLVIHIGNRHISVQVKSGFLPLSRADRTIKSYLFGAGPRANGTRRDLSLYVGKVDILAFVALEKRIILYELPASQVTGVRAIREDNFTLPKSELSWNCISKALRFDGGEKESGHGCALSFGI